MDPLPGKRQWDMMSPPHTNTHSVAPTRSDVPIGGEQFKLLSLALDYRMQGLTTVTLFCDGGGQILEHVGDLGKVVIDALAFCAGCIRAST